MTPAEFMEFWADWIPSDRKRMFLEDVIAVKAEAQASERRRLTTDLAAFWNARDETIREIEREGGRVL